ncbi:uncharacterized protein LOC121678487 [Alosa sapidissima]|uniref:uncharacterized protein LOC121678487 n=1 Tax=Alosa sapidissima TaxID=34773 RepID=UPI001C0986B5|nr:uncharacterized protein LOC121678487 [Alosa sapidissima]
MVGIVSTLVHYKPLLIEVALSHAMSTYSLCSPGFRVSWELHFRVPCPVSPAPEDPLHCPPQRPLNSGIHHPEESSEQPEPILPNESILSPILWSLDEQMAAARESDPAPPNTPAARAYVPRQLRIQLLTSAHCTPGHPGTNATLTLLRDRYWWPGMTRDIRRFVAGCQDCAMANSSSPPCGEVVSSTCATAALVAPWSRLCHRPPTVQRQYLHPCGGRQILQSLQIHSTQESSYGS